MLSYCFSNIVLAMACLLAFRSPSFNFRMGASTVPSIVIETCEAFWTVLRPIQQKLQGLHGVHALGKRLKHPLTEG